MELAFHRSPNKYIGGVSIKVEDLKRSIAFYHNLLGFKILEQKENKVVFSADGKKPLLIVEQPDNVIRKQVRTTGLYHFAILLPERKDLANALYHLIQMNYPLQVLPIIWSVKRSIWQTRMETALKFMLIESRRIGNGIKIKL